MREPIRSVRLSDADWAALQRIAAERGILYGGIPSRGAALVWLIRREIERLSRRRKAEAAAGPPGPTRTP
jgi:hypothetical protein